MESLRPTSRRFIDLLNNVRTIFASAVSAYKLEYAIVFICMTICLASFSYIDTVTYTVWSIDIWEALFDGRITDYFTVTAENKWGSLHGGNCYGVLWLVPWALWNFPIWAIQTVVGDFSVYNPACIIWSKLFLVVCTVASAIYVRKIVKHVTDDVGLADLGALLTVGSGVAMLSVGFAGQDEVLYLLSFLIGTHLLMTGKRWWAFVFFCYTMACYPVMILPLLVILLMHERNTLKVLAYSVATLIPDRVVSMACGISAVPGLREEFFMAEDFTMDKVLNWYFYISTLPGAHFTISLFAIICAGLLIYSCLKKSDNRIYASAVCITIYFLTMYVLCTMHFYRFFPCIVPAIIAILILAKDRPDLLNVCLLLLTVLTYAMCLVSSYTSMFYESLENTVIGEFWDWREGINFFYMFTERFPIFHQRIYGIIGSASIAVIATLFIILIKKPVLDMDMKGRLRCLTCCYVMSSVVLLVVFFATPFIL